MSMTDGAITSSVDERGIARITIDRPNKRNALSRPMMQALGDAISAADADPAVRAILLQSTGQTFCAGADLGNLASSPLLAEQDPGHHALLALAGATKPLVAAVQGAAVGMGATMLLHFDAILATDQASLRMPFVELGLTPEGGATFLLTARIGHVKAAQLLLSCDPVGAAEALSMGLVTRIVSADALVAEADAAAARLAAMPPVALRQAKAMMTTPDLVARMDAEQETFRASLRLPEFGEAVAAARERIGHKAQA